MIQAEQVLAALGGADNVVSVEPCITRLRVLVHDGAAVDDGALTRAGAFGVVHSGRIIQVIVGPAADALAADVDRLR